MHKSYTASTTYCPSYLHTIQTQKKFYLFIECIANKRRLIDVGDVSK